MAKPTILRRVKDALIRVLSPAEVEDWQPVQIAVFAVGTGIGIQLEYGGYKNVTTVLPAESTRSLIHTLKTVLAQAEVNSRQGLGQGH